MHVLFVTGEYPPLRGGVGAYTAELAHALVDIGSQVSVLTTRQAHPAVQPTNAVTVHALIERWDWRIWHQAAQLAKQIGATWLHVQYQTAAFAMHPAINLAPDYWRRGQPFRVAWTYHDLLVPYLFPKAGARLRRWITERPAHTSHIVIATNTGDYQQLAVCALTAPLVKIPIGSNIHVHASSPSARAQARAQDRRERGYTESTVVLGYFGFLNHSKGGLTLIQTLQELVLQGIDAHLLMIGERIGASDPTNEAYLQSVEALITELHLEQRVQWTGHLADAEASRALHMVDLLFMPYLDGASLRRGTLMAGLAHGCAIVTTAPQSPLPELVNGRDLLYVPPGDAQAAASAIRQVMQQPTLRTQLATNAQRQSEQFTWATIAQQHRAHYQSPLTTQQ